MKKDIVQEFYNVTPFPDYELDRFDEKEDLTLSAESLPKILDRSISAHASIIDVGTGTGQLSAYLALRRSQVWGIDFSQASLSKAESLKKKLGIKTLHLKQIDILNESEIGTLEGQFDYLLCLGVLHHTSDPYKAFQNILKLVKPGGYIAVGLYNKYGRWLLRVRRFLVSTIFKNNARIKDWFIRMQLGDTPDQEKRRGWWNDQYLHPRESLHTVGELLNWFKKNNIEYMQSLPSLEPMDDADIDIAGVWNTVGEKYPNILVRFYKQLKWIWTTHKDGGYWVMFGKKKDG